MGNWIYSPINGYQYVDSGSTTSSVWVYDSAIGDWFWTSQSFYPALFDLSIEAWYYYYGSATPNRWFYDYTANDYVQEGDL